MSIPDHARRVATLWSLSWENDSISCIVYRTDDGLRLTVESPAAVIVSEALDLRPRVLARVQALRDSLKQRGWREVQQ